MWFGQIKKMILGKFLIYFLSIQQSTAITLTLQQQLNEIEIAKDQIYGNEIETETDHTIISNKYDLSCLLKQLDKEIISTKEKDYVAYLIRKLPLEFLERPDP